MCSSWRDPAKQAVRLFDPEIHCETDFQENLQKLSMYKKCSCSVKFSVLLLLFPFIINILSIICIRIIFILKENKKIWLPVDKTGCQNTLSYITLETRSKPQCLRANIWLMTPKMLSVRNCHIITIIIFDPLFPKTKWGHTSVSCAQQRVWMAAAHPTALDGSYA